MGKCSSASEVQAMTWRYWRGKQHGPMRRPSLWARRCQAGCKLTRGGPQPQAVHGLHRCLDGGSNPRLTRGRSWSLPRRACGARRTVTPNVTLNKLGID